MFQSKKIVCYFYNKDLPTLLRFHKKRYLIGKQKITYDFLLIFGHFSHIFQARQHTAQIIIRMYILFIIFIKKGTHFYLRIMVKKISKKIFIVKKIFFEI